ncbi:MAG TPA: DUF222 domain-containing protein, partial [Mycobacteriales bacterium]|nr:DUF222 domain-containing protein [Mycobacteriales bacterium]
MADAFDRGDLASAGECLVDFRVQISRLEAQFLAGLARFDRAGGAAACGGDTTVGWLRRLCGLGGAAARTAVTTARGLADRLSATRAALAEGALSYQHATVLAVGTAGLPDDVVSLVEPMVIDAARRVDLDPAQTRALLDEAIYRLDPRIGDARETAKRDRLGFWAARTLDGMVALKGLLDPESGEVVLAAVHAVAGSATPPSVGAGLADPTLLRQNPARRRAEALVELCRRALDSGQLADQGGERPHVGLVVDLAALADAARAANGELPRPLPDGAPGPSGGSGAVNTLSGRPSSTDPAGDRSGDSGTRDAERTGLGRRVFAELGWTGPIGMATALRLCCDASVARIVMNGPSEVLDVGRRTRLVPAGLRRAVLARDRGCIAVGCSRPAAFCDVHHIWHWAAGGPTRIDNLVLLCRA